LTYRVAESDASRWTNDAVPASLTLHVFRSGTPRPGTNTLKRQLILLHPRLAVVMKERSDRVRAVQIPVFVSAPTHLSEAQDAARRRILVLLEEFGLEPRALGRSEYPVDYPLREVAVIARDCSGGVILGFEQFRSLSGIARPGSSTEQQVKEPRSFPTAWNNLEAGILFALRVPLLIFREATVQGGVFDVGVTEAFVHLMPSGDPRQGDPQELRNVLLRWQSRVRERYYSFD
jgi:hypothetical protein